MPYLGRCLDALAERAPGAEVVVADWTDEKTRAEVRERWHAIAASLAERFDMFDDWGMFAYTNGALKPWGDYLVRPGYEYSPFVFADTLLRSGLPFAGVEVEWYLGTSPRGSGAPVTGWPSCSSRATCRR